MTQISKIFKKLLNELLKYWHTLKYLKSIDSMAE